MNILYIAEIVGKAGIYLIKKELANLKKEYQADFVIVNANSVTGSGGIGKQHALYLKKLGADCITAGDCIFHRKDLVNCIDSFPYILRPFNLPNESPGCGWAVFLAGKDNEKIAVVSCIGRIGHHRIMAENPFIETEKLIVQLKEQTSFIVIDFSSFASAEKKAFGFMLAGKVSAVIGSGSRVQTADECIFDNKTAYITDSGRTGSLNSVGGYAIDDKIREYLTCLPDFGKEAWSKPCIQGVSINLDSSGSAYNIQRIFKEYACYEKKE